MGEKIIEPTVVAAMETVPALSGKVFPLGAPEKVELPFSVYVSSGATEDECLSGWLGSYTTEMEINILHSDYKAMKLLVVQVVEVLKQLEEVSISIDEGIPESYAHDINAYRKVINIKILH